MKAFIDKIITTFYKIEDEVKFAVKEEFALINVKSNVNELSHKPIIANNIKNMEGSLENVNEILLNALHSEILFLRDELLSKDKIINMLLDDHNYNCNSINKYNKTDGNIIINNNNIQTKANGKIRNESNNNCCEPPSVKKTNINEHSGTKTNNNKRIVSGIGDSMVKDLDTFQMKNVYP